MQYAGEILKLTRLSKARMKESWQAAPLRLVIGCRNAAELRFLSPALERLRQERPEVLPVLRLIPFDSVENLLAEGDVHLIFSFRDQPAQGAVPGAGAMSGGMCVQRYPSAGGAFLGQCGRFAACRADCHLPSPVLSGAVVCGTESGDRKPGDPGDFVLRSPGGAVFPGGDRVCLCGDIGYSQCPDSRFNLYPHAGIFAAFLWSGVFIRGKQPAAAGIPHDAGGKPAAGG